MPPAASTNEHPDLPPEFVPLPDDASPQAKDRHWYETCYMGDKMPQLTFRAVAMGAILGMLMSISNLYTTLKVGWSFGVAITSCVLSFVIWNTIRTVMRGVSNMSVLENNCMQSTASAAGYSTGATIATAFGALLILDPTHQHQPWWVVASFTLATGAMGVWLAIPMKRQMINQEQLPFPSGIAAATTLRSLYSRGGDAIRKAYALVAGLGIGGLVGVLNTPEDQFVGLGKFFAFMRAKLFDVHLPDQVPEKGFGLLAGKPMVGFGFEPSVLLISAGMIVGLRVSLSMLASASLLYLVIAPWLQGIDAANATVQGYIASIPSAGGGTMFHPRNWALWGGTSIMVFASLASLGLQWKSVGRAFTMLRRGPATNIAKDDIDASMAAIEVPNSWFIAGLIPITIAIVIVLAVAFKISWWAGLIAVIMSFVLSMVACRATGETDTTPIGAMGKVMQLLFAAISPGNIQHNLMAAGAGANSASSSADLLTDLKSGYHAGGQPTQAVHRAGDRHPLRHARRRAGVVPAHPERRGARQVPAARDRDVGRRGEGALGRHREPADVGALGHPHRWSGRHPDPDPREELPQGAAVPAVGHGPRPRLGGVLLECARVHDRRVHRVGVGQVQAREPGALQHPARLGPRGR
jgi:OPT family oligopeptide transporter